MMPNEIIAENAKVFRQGTHELFESVDEVCDTIGIELKRKADSFDLKLTKTDLYGHEVIKEISPQSSIDAEKHTRFVDFGYGLSFSIAGGAICLDSSFLDYSGYFKTDADVVISDLKRKNSLAIAASTITIRNNVFSDFNLTLSADSILNHGVISSPLLDIRSKSITNEGLIAGKTILVDAEKLLCQKESVISATALLDIKAKEKILCGSASIGGKQLKINASNAHFENGSYLKSGAAFDFFGKEFHISNSSFETANKAHFMVSDFCNDNSKVEAATEIAIFAGVFFNGGSLNSKSIDINSYMEESDQHFLLDRRFGCIANSGTIKADDLSLAAELYLFNRGVLDAKERISLSSSSKLFNEGSILQREYSPTIVSKISSGSKIINRSGLMDFCSNLLINGEAFDNTKGILNARQLRMQLALDKKQEFQENKKEISAAQTESNPYSENFQNYARLRNSADTQAAPKPDEPDLEKEKKHDPPEIGILINTDGNIRSDRSLEIKGSGAIYNAEQGTISAKDTISIDIFGRLLNQLEGVIAANLATVKSAGKVFNTGGASMDGLFVVKSNGFENGIGSSIKGGLRVDSSASIFNFGEIQAVENPLLLATDFSIKNYGSMISNGSIGLKAKQELVNDGGKIVAAAVDTRKTPRIFNKSGGLMEAKTGDVTFADGVALLNEGRISSHNIKLTQLIPAVANSRTINQGGVMDARHLLSISSDYAFDHLHGIISALEIVYENRSGKTVDLAKLLKNSGLRTQKASFSFPNAKLENKSETVLAFDTQIFAKEFHNLSLLHSTKELRICSATGFLNGLDHVFEEPIFSLAGDYDIEYNPRLQSLLGGVLVDLAPERKVEKTIISAVGNLFLESGTRIRNTGSFRAGKRIFLKSPRIHHGWAHESIRHESLPGLKFNYDYLESQPSYMIAEQGMTIEANEFLNTLGIIDAKGGLISTNKNIFLNYGGSIDVRGNAEITAPIFAHMIGTVKTNRMDKRYWSLEFCNTDSPTFNVLDGVLAINAPYALNSGGHIFAQNGVLLEGKRTNGLPAVVDISSSGLGYGRMYSVNEYNKGKYSDRILGISMASTGLGAVIRAELNETVKKRLLPASISSGKQVIINGYKNLKSTGIIHGGAVHIKTGAGLTELGYTGDAILPSVSGFTKTVELFPYISSFADNQAWDTAGESSNFFFKSVGGKLKIPFSIIDDGVADLQNLRLPFSPEVLEVMLTKQLQAQLGTGYLSDMPTFLDAAKVARTKAKRKVAADTFVHLKDYTAHPIALVSPADAKHGLFFRPQKLGNHTLLFPELHLAPNSVHAALANPAGATVAQGERDANVIIDTDGFLHATASLHADDHIRVKAARGALFETSTYDAIAVTQNQFAESHRSGFLGLESDTTYHKITEWHRLKKAREPMLITTTRGDFVIVIPDDKEAVEFKGMFADIAGNFEVHGGNCILSPLEIAAVVSCPKVGSIGRISTLLPVFLQTVLKTKKDFLADVRVFKSTAGKIQAIGDVVIKASDRIEFNTATKKFTLTEGTTVDEGTFTTKTSSRKVDDVMSAQSSVEAGGNIKIKTDTANLSGQFKADGDIAINARIARLKSDLAYGTDDFRSNASNWFSSASYHRVATFARVAPTIFQCHGDFIADITEAYFEHSIQKKCRDERIRAPHIDSTPQRVHETVVETSSSSGFNLFLPTAVYAPLCDGDIKGAIDAFWRQSSLLTATKSLLHSRRGADLAVSGISTALAAYSSLKTILDYGVGGTASLFGIGGFGFYNVETKSSTTHDFTVPSVTTANRNIEWQATAGDINITHRIAKAGGNQRYIAAGKILVAPGKDSTQTTSSTTSSGVGFNVFTMDANANYSSSSSSSKSTHREASKFKSAGTNVFRAGNGISIVIPQIEGKRNVFDAMVVHLENKANEEETHSSSSGFGLSTNLAKAAALTAAVNMSAGGSRDTKLNDAFIRGATDFMHSKVLNQGCNVMNITNRGASYQYIPGAEVHKSHNFAIGLSGLDLSSPEAFAYSLGRSMLSAAASAGVGMLASEAGLGGFVSSLAASLAGSYVNSEVLPQRNPSDASGRRSSSSASGQRNSSDASANPNWKLPPLSSNSSVEFDHNGSGFHAVNIDFNHREFQATVDTLKAKIFGQCLDQNMSTSEAVKRIELVGEYAEDAYAEAIENEDVSQKEAIAITKEKSEILNKISEKIERKIKQEESSATTTSSKEKPILKPKAPDKVSEKIERKIKQEESSAATASSKGKPKLKPKAPDKVSKKIEQKTKPKESSVTTTVGSVGTAGHERLLAPKPTAQQLRESEAYQFLISKRMEEVSADPHNKSNLRKLRVTVESYASEYPRLAKLFGQTLEACGNVATVGGGYALTVGILAAAGTTIGAAPALASATIFGVSTYLVHKASEALGEVINYAEAKVAEWQVDNAYERTKLTADYSLAGLIGMASAGRLKKVTTSVGKNVSNINKRLVGRMEIISEREIVSKAASMPGEWNGQFKLVREIQPVAHGNEFASNVYCREVVFKDPKSGQMFRAFQRNDIDPNYVVRSGDYAGHKNLELMSRGLAPYTSTDEQVIIHHMGQNAFGPFVEVTKTTHKSFLHNQFGYKQLHPTAPVIRSEFNPIRQAYWRAYAESFK